MNTRIAHRLGTLLLVGAVASLSFGCESGGGPTEQPPQPTDERGAEATAAPSGWGGSAEWVKPSDAGVDANDFVAGVDNPYWPLVSGAKWTYQATTDEGTETISVVVLDETKRIMGVDCTTVRDTVRRGDEIIEDTRDWYAQDDRGNVWYMGEAVDNYEDGRLVDHEGSWEAGEDGALPGIKVWAEPHIGQPPYYQEFYRGEAEDLARDISDAGSASVAFGEFDDLLVVEEWTPLDPAVVERKYYRKGIGTVKEEMVRGGDEVTELTEYEKP